MKLKSYIALALAAAIILVPITIYLQLPPGGTPGSKISRTNDLVPHERIVIQDVSEFTAPGTNSGCKCVRGGVGSPSDPFVISDWKLSASSGNGISISGTAVHFVILNVMVNVTAAYDSLVLHSVANGTIQDSTFSGGGISLYNSGVNSILNNSIIGSRFGILLEASNGNTVSGNRLDRIQQVGIFVRASDNLIDGNRVAGGSFGGINIDGMTGSGDNNRIVNNVVEGNAEYGVGLWRAHNNFIKGNIISGNGGPGVMFIASCTGNVVEQNKAVNNGADGVLVDEQSTDNKVAANTVTGNGDGMISFDLHDKGRDNIWVNNTFDTRSPDTIN
jgi:parallel beta-helix repeat protein